MVIIKKYGALLLLFLLSVQCSAQTKKIEALQARLQQATTATAKLDGILALCEEHHSLNRDTLYNLALEAKLLAVSQSNDKKRLAAIALSNAYMKWGWADSALEVIEAVLTEAKGDNKSIYYKMLREQAIVYGGKNNLEKGLAILFPALTAAENSKDTLNMAAIMNSIGSMKMASQQYDEALIWIGKASRLCTNNPACKTTQAAIYTNAANAYMQKSMLDSCLLYIEQAITLSRETEDLLILATALRIKSSVLTTQKKFAEAETAIKEMIEIRYRSQGDNLFIEDHLQLADFYANTGQLEKAIQLCKQMLQTGNLYDTTFRLPAAIFTNSPQLRLEYWQALAKYYKQGNRQPEYQQALEQIVILKDSVYITNSERAIADAETKYEVQKKENTILQQKYSLQESRFLLFGLLGLMAMALLVTYFILRDYRRKQKIKMELAMAEERAKAAAAVKVAEEKERVRIAADLHDNIGAYASAIKSDVEKMALGASDIVNPQLQSLQHHSQEIINSLRDTIWVLNKENITITGISDRIKNYISKLQASYEQVQFNISETIVDDIRINSPTALNIFRIVQEAVHNALKHSSATEVDIIIASTNKVTISITDNGRGMDLSLQNGKGNGLINMKARAVEAGLQLGIESIVNKGTTVFMQLPTIN